MNSLYAINDEQSVESRRRFYMLLRNGWRQMTHEERRLLGDSAREYEFICPLEWDVDSSTHLRDLKEARRIELEKDKDRILKSGGKWVEIKK